MSIADIVILSLALLSVAVLIFVKVRAVRGKNKGCCDACAHCSGSCDCAHCAHRPNEQMKK